MKDLREIIEHKILQKGFTKTLIYNELEMTRTGFEYALKNDTLKVRDFAKIAKLLSINVNDFFELENQIDINQVNEPLVEYGKRRNDTKSDTDTSEVVFLRSQLQKMTEIVDRLSKQIDTKNINS